MKRITHQSDVFVGQVLSCCFLSLELWTRFGWPFLCCSCGSKLKGQQTPHHGTECDFLLTGDDPGHGFGPSPSCVSAFPACVWPPPSLHGEGPCVSVQGVRLLVWPWSERVTVCAANPSALPALPSPSSAVSSPGEGSIFCHC